MITFSPPEREERGVFSPSGSTLLTSILLHMGEKMCWGSALVSMRIRIQLFISMRILVRLKSHKKISFLLKGNKSLNFIKKS
jgi:hypothetical protein